MDRSIPHFLRFTRALALVSGAALVLPACGGAVDTGPQDAAYDGYATGTPAVTYDGSVMGTAPAPDATVPGIDAGITGYPYDGGPVGTPVYDAGTDADDAEVAETAPPPEAGVGGPLAPPDLPA